MQKNKIIFISFDTNKPMYESTVNAVEQLKSQRKLAPTIAKALQLFSDLQTGNTDSLEQFFPNVVNKLKEPSHTSNEILISEIRSMLKTLPAGDMQALGSGRAAEKPAKSDDFGMDDLVITQAKSDENAAYNMQISGLSLGVIKVEELPQEVLRYGLERGKFSGDQKATAQKIVDAEPKPAKEIKGPKKMAIADIDLPPPDIDDLLLDDVI